MKTNGLKFCSLFLLMICAASLLHGEVSFRTFPVIARRIEIKTDKTISIAAGGKVLCEVVLPQKSAPMLRLAASELVFYLEKITGGKVAVRNTPSQKCPAFILGKNGAELAGFDLKKMDRDGYIIKTVGRNIVIAGNDDPQVDPRKKHHYNERGTLYGVYEFLERFGGVRFYFPGEIGTVVPRKKDWQLPQIDIVDRPDMQYRRNYTGKGALGKKIVFYAGMPEKDIRLYSDLQMRLSTTRVTSSHGLAYLGLTQRFAKTHPEYFALRTNGKRHDGSVITSRHDAAGQLCFSNEGLKNEIFLDAKALLTGQPASSRGIVAPNGKSGWVASRHSRPFFCISPNDSIYKCRCAGCYPAFSARGRKSSTLIWKFVADIANRLKKENIPGYLTMSAYSCFVDVPDVDIPDNVVTALCQTGPWNESHPADQEKSLKLLKAWRKKLGAKPYIYTYVCKSNGRGTVLNIPGFTPRAIASFYKKVDQDVFGSFLEAGTDFWLFNFMNYYVFGKIMWDSSTDVDALLAEHFQLMYGAAAPQMKEFYTTLERHWMKDIIGKTRNTPLGPQPVLPSLYEVWTKIYGPAELVRIGKLFDEAEKNVSGDPDALKRVKFMRRELFGPILAGAADFKQMTDSRKLWTIHAQPVKEKISIDGKLDEAAWKKAETVWLLPRKTGIVEVHTRVKMLADQDHFYVGMECDEPFTDKMLAHKRAQDDSEVWRDNLVELFFSSSSRDNFYYQFMLSSAGIACDLRKENKTLNVKWNSGLTYKCTVTPGKMWTVEIRIPRRSMPELKGGSFIVNFRRGRLLAPGPHIQTGYYSWTRYLANYSSEDGGTAVIGPLPESRSIIPGGDFDLPVFGKRMRHKGKNVWISNSPLTVDKQVFITKGCSMRLEHPGGNRTLRHFWDKTLLKAGKKYKLSFYLKMENVVNRKHPRSGFYVDIRFGKTGADNVLLPLKPSLLGTMDWTRYQFEFTVPEGVGTQKSPYFGFYLLPGAEGKVWIDHVELLPAEK